MIAIPALVPAMSDPHPPSPDETSVEPAAVRAGPEEQLKTWESTELLGEEAEAVILHRGQRYRLRCTKQGKLILYK